MPLAFTADVARPSVDCAQRDPGGSVLYQIVREHFETFRTEAAHLRDGDGLPRFVEEEFEAFLRCGWLAGGFARFRCGDGGTDRLVGFSCTGRGFCASRGGRRMTERAAHLVDHVFPDVPIRRRDDERAGRGVVQSVPGRRADAGATLSRAKAYPANLRCVSAQGAHNEPSVNAGNA